jgi:hypothetical protein
MPSLGRVLRNRYQAARHDADALDDSAHYDDAGDFGDVIDAVAPIAGGVVGGVTGGPAGAAAGYASGKQVAKAYDYASSQANQSGGGSPDTVAFLQWAAKKALFDRGWGPDPGPQPGSGARPGPWAPIWGNANAPHIHVNSPGNVTPPPWNPAKKGPKIKVNGSRPRPGAFQVTGGPDPRAIMAVGRVEGRGLSADSLRAADLLFTTPALRGVSMATLSQRASIRLDPVCKGAIALAYAIRQQTPGGSLPTLEYHGAAEAGQTFDDLLIALGAPSAAVGVEWGAGKIGWRAISQPLMEKLCERVPAALTLGATYLRRVSLIGNLIQAQQAQQQIRVTQNQIRAQVGDTRIFGLGQNNAMGLADAAESTTDTNPPGALPYGASLSSDGHVHYSVQPGDYGYGIPPKFGQSQGQVNELRAANPGKNWNTMPAGTDLLIPDNWIDPAVLNPPAPPPQLPPAVPPIGPPTFNPPQTVPPNWTPPPPPVLPVGVPPAFTPPGTQPPASPPGLSSAGFQQALLLVAAWGKSTTRIVPPGFGDTTGDLVATGPNPRNSNAFMSFQQWWNQQGKGSGLNENGQLDDATYQSLMAWSATSQGKEAKAAGNSMLPILLGALGLAVTVFK